ncbi:MAG: hypothetical protein OdinLCB4_001175 [Candidatus Odinarchaeum yellowstonii]|uniref:Uncharacterized protein n=1 Tax=Odinarchaeota yellowstonii (strain LCB_4) TaxID=1841599 RepID=A0AAF0ICJ3_ODILC|nr:MAG: hypothetical protein OdinLCB4_001175 [Candidatus Odinarchaeum yellowstonii]
MLNFGNIKRSVVLNLSNKRKVVALIVLIIGLVEVAAGLILLFSNASVEEIIRGVFILIYGGLEFITGLAGLILKFKSDYNLFTQIARYIIIILLFIPYTAVIISLIVYDPVLNAFRLNALILSLVSLINLISIPITKYLYNKETNN